MESRREGRFELARRQFFGASAMAPLFGSALLSGCGPARTTDEQWRDFLSDVAALLIPHTDTAAADDPYVWAQDIALNGIYVGMDGATYDMLGLVRDALDDDCGGSYLRSSDARRFAALEKLDASSYGATPLAQARPASSQPNLPQQQDALAGPQPPALPQTPLAIAWRKIKGLLLLGYYTSQAGASQELRYELVPGRFDPDVPVTPDTRAISSDWFAVSFR